MHALERVAGIEPAPSAWKAEVLPLNYTRLPDTLSLRFQHLPDADFPRFVARQLVEGAGFEPAKLARQIYSLIPLTAREPLPKEPGIL